MSDPTTATDAKTQAAGGRPRMKWRRRVRRSAIAILVLLIVIEIGSRLFLGMGNPPLMQLDPKIEYLFQPNQSTRRFGNRIHYNAHSMRADDFPATKSSPDELRIYAIGDSVLNGGAQTDQDDLATSIIQRELSRKLNRRVVVGNASASSWGPANELAYLEKFTLLDADVLLIVISSHDVVDAPTFAPSVGVSLDMPDRKPLCATSELVTRYIVPRLMAMFATVPPPQPKVHVTLDNPDVQRSLDELRQMIAKGRDAGARVVVAQHIERAEANGQLLPGHGFISDAAQKAGAEVVQLGPAFDESFRAGRDPWRDSIHPNTLGQRLMADVLIPVLESKAGREGTKDTK